MTVSPTGTVCPEVVVNFTCSTPSSYMRWTASHGTDMIQQVTFTTDNSISSTEYRILGSTDYLLKATLVSHTPEFTSNLTVTAAPELNGLTVQCDSESTGREVVRLQISGIYN